MVQILRNYLEVANNFYQRENNFVVLSVNDTVAALMEQPMRIAIMH